jgi:hypothetical protein
MPSPEQAKLWTTLAPPEWPRPPDEMTVSMLAEIEACPRRWALSSADYPALWTGRGYPPRVHLSSLAGSVVHLVLETVTRELVRARCLAVEDAAATQVMRRLGGYTKVVHDCIDGVVARFAGNPRAWRHLETAVRSLRAQAAELRTRAQTLLGRVRLHTITGGRSRTAGAAPRRALSNGLYPEVELRARQIGWKGKADLLVLSDGESELIDFKTGAEDDSHKFQLQVYALLWSRDDELNPTGRLPTKLTLAYCARNVEVDVPSAAWLQILERDLIVRRAAGRRAVAVRPPEARPTADNCRYCGVRQLCDNYWTEETQHALGSALPAEDVLFSDFELTITGRHGPSSWDAVVEVSRYVATGRQVLVRAGESVLAVRAGQRIRILDAHVAPAHDEDVHPVVVTMGSLSEAYSAS